MVSPRTKPSIRKRVALVAPTLLAVGAIALLANQSRRAFVEPERDETRYPQLLSGAQEEAGSQGHDGGASSESPSVVFTDNSLTEDDRRRQHELLTPLFEALGPSEFFLEGPPVGDPVSEHIELLSLADAISTPTDENDQSIDYWFELYEFEHVRCPRDATEVVIHVADERISSIVILYTAE